MPCPAPRLVLVLVLLGACSTEGAEPFEPGAGGKADDFAEVSFGQLAGQRVIAQVDEMLSFLEVVDDDVLPHEAKDARRQIAWTRDFLDIFAYAYDDKGGDPWKDIREELDDGYEILGAFKDIYDRQGVEDSSQAAYDEAEVDELREEVLEWYEDFIEPSELGETLDYLGDPDLDEIHKRQKSGLSPYFWGAITIHAKDTMSGRENVARLAKALCEAAEDIYDDVLELRKIHKESNQEEFHAFRKRVRSITRMARYFPDLWEVPLDDPELDALLTTLDEMVSGYGAIGDKMLAYHHALEEDDEDEAEDLEDEIRDDWRDLRDWQHAKDIDEVLDDLHSLLD